MNLERMHFHVMDGGVAVDGVVFGRVGEGVHLEVTLELAALGDGPGQRVAVGTRLVMPDGPHVQRGPARGAQVDVEPVQGRAAVTLTATAVSAVAGEHDLEVYLGTDRVAVIPIRFARD